MPSALLLLGAALAACPPLPQPVGLVLVAPEGLEDARGPAKAALMVASGDAGLALSTLPVDPLQVESGWVERRSKLANAELKLRRAEANFRELDDRAALSLISELTVGLAAVQQEPGANQTLAQAHLAAAAVFLARGRVDAARTRLTRALDLWPKISADPTTYAPRLIAELEAARSQAPKRPRGELRVHGPLPRGSHLYVDGRDLGPVPGRFSLPEGSHLARLSAPGRLSHFTPLRIRGGELSSLRARLPRDPELRRLSTLRAALDSPEEREALLSLLATRVGEPAVLVAALRPSSRLDPLGTPRTALTLYAAGRPPVFIDNTEAGALAEGLSTLLRCEGRAPAWAAPPILGAAPLRASAPPVREQAVWERPWFWALCGALAVGGATALVAIENRSTAPDSYGFTITPRP